MTNPKLRLAEIMQTEVASLAPNERLDLAEDVMKLGRVRHLPVLDGHRLVGIVSNRDLLAASLSNALDFEASQRRTFLRSIDVSEVMTTSPATLGPDDTLAAAAELMVTRKIGCVPIVEGDVFQGLVTETDLLRAALLGKSGAAPAGAEEEPAGTEEEPVLEARERFEKEMQDLRRLRDELRVQVHLGLADAKDQWERLEQRFGELEGRARRMAERAEDPLEEIGKAAQRLADELREGYRRLRELL